nr:hypothetical protein [Ningiella sp. W23]
MNLKIVIKNTTRTLLKPWLNVFNQGEELPSRRYDLDWLRVLAFGLLIFTTPACYTVKIGAFILKVSTYPAVLKTSCFYCRHGGWD